MPGMENMARWQYVSLAFLSNKSLQQDSPRSTFHGKGLLWEQEQVAVQWWFFLLWTSQNWTKFVFLLPSAGQDIAFGLNRSASKTAANYSLTWSWLLLGRPAVRADKSFRNKNSIKEPLPPLHLHCGVLMDLHCMGYDRVFTGPAAALPGHPDPARKADAEGVLFWLLPALPLWTVPWQEAAHPFSSVLQSGDLHFVLHM